MTFRNPIYLDLSLLKNLADYYDVGVLTPRQVTEHAASGRNARLGVDRGVQASIQGAKAHDITEVYSTELRPVRLVNNVIDYLLSDDGELIDLVGDSTAPIQANMPIQVEGRLVLSPATEIGTIMESLMPLLISRFVQGEENPAPTARELIPAFTRNQDEGIQVYDLETEDNERSFVLILDPANIPEDRTSEDIEGELTVFGVIDRLISPSTSLSLVRYILPGMSRTIRRAFAKTSLDEFIEGYGAMTGRVIDGSALSINGPAVVVKPVAIY